VELATPAPKTRLLARIGATIAGMPKLAKTACFLPFIVAFAGLGAACTGNPEASKGDPDPEVFAAEVDRRLDSDPNKRVCRSYRPTGSMRSQRICKSNAEWAKIEADSQTAIKAIQRDQSVSTGESGGGG
jgi:hypothetical protein